jgi:sugar phosphate isomerase/epimerase
MKRALELAEYVPFRYMVTHVGVSREEFDERKLDAAFSSIEHLRMFARQRGADLVLENIPNELSTPERLVHFLRYTHMLDLGMCFDTGHAHMADGVAASFEKMGPHVRTTHVHDNLGEKDDHLYPFEGSIDWKQAIGSFLAAQKAHSFPVLLELREAPELAEPLDKVREVFRRFEEMEASSAKA